MSTIPKKVAERLVAGVKQFQPILASAKSRDLNESDTVTIVKDMMAAVFGYDKYAELTSEMSIRGNYCDLATKLDGVVATLIEVKAVGIELKDQHVRQAVDYAANQGVEWVLLTNGIMWRVYRVQFSKPIEHELVVEVNFCAISPKSTRDLECLYLWCKEGWIRSVLGDFAAQKEALSPYFLGALMLSDSVLDVMRRELRRISPDVHIDTDEIKTVLLNEVIKREILEGDKADIARRKIARCANYSLRVLRPKECVPEEPAATPAVADGATQ